MLNEEDRERLKPAGRAVDDLLTDFLDEIDDVRREMNLSEHDMLKVVNHWVGGEVRDAYEDYLGDND